MDELMLPIFGHFKAKEYSFLKHIKNSDFDTVRDVCNEYSRKKLGYLFVRPVMAFIFIWFAEAEEPRNYLRKTLLSKQSKVKDHVDFMMKDIRNLGRKAFELGL